MAAAWGSGLPPTEICASAGCASVTTAASAMAVPKRVPAVIDLFPVSSVVVSGGPALVSISLTKRFFVGLSSVVPALAGTTRRRFFVSAETCYEHPTCTSLQSQQEVP